MYEDYKLYISYFEKLINYYKENKEEKMKERVKKYVNYMNYCCTDFITFNNSNQEEIMKIKLRFMMKSKAIYF